MLATINNKYIPVFLVVLCYVSRLPQMLSPHFFLDGDECVLATMSKHLVELKYVSLYFLGQKYGFSFLETLFIAPFHAVLGVGTMAPKLGILTLWTCGVVFFYKALLRMNGGSVSQALILTLVLLLSPAWAVWSMKARGGYVTSFVLSTVVLYMVHGKNTRLQLPRWLFIGCLIALIYESQVFWLFGLLPLVLYMIVARRQWLGLMIMTIAGLILYAYLNVYKKDIVSVYTPSIHWPSVDVAWQYSKRIPKYLFNSLHGGYYFFIAQKPNLFQAIYAYLVAAVAVVLPVAGVVMVKNRGKAALYFFCATVFVLPCLAITLFTETMEFRYLLPISGFVLIATQIFITQHGGVRPTFVIAGILTVCGLVSLITFYNFKFMEGNQRTLFDMTSFLERKNIRHVYSTHCMLPWQITYYTDENILARMPYTPGRYNPYHMEVDSAFKAKGRVAIVGYRNELGNMKLDSLIYLHEFFICINPPEEELSKGFSIPGYNHFE